MIQFLQIFGIDLGAHFKIYRFGASLFSGVTISILMVLYLFYYFLVAVLLLFSRDKRWYKIQL